MPETVRDAYALAEQLAALTGRDAQRCIEAAGAQAHSDKAARIAPLLQDAAEQFRNGVVVDWLPEPAPVVTGTVRLYARTEEEDWL